MEVVYRLDGNFHVDEKCLHFMIWEVYFFPNPVGEVALLLCFGILGCSGLEWDLPEC